MLAGQQLVQQHAKRVDVGRRGDRPPDQLLGRRVLRRHRASRFVRQLGGSPGRLVLEQLRDAEVEQLDRPVAVTSTFDGFRSRCTMRLACACATAASTSRNSAIRAVDAEALFVAVPIDVAAVDVLEHEIRLARRRDAGVDQPRDVRMREPRQDACLRA